MTPRPKTLPERVLELLGDGQWRTPIQLHEALAPYALSSVTTTVHRLIKACYPIERKYVGRSPNTLVTIFAYRLKKPVDPKTGS